MAAAPTAAATVSTVAAAVSAAASAASAAALTSRASFVDYKGSAFERLLVSCLDCGVGLVSVNIDETEAAALDYPRCGRTEVRKVFEQVRLGRGIGKVPHI